MDPTFVEQDHPSTNNGNDPPTYEDLAAQNGPNSRFGHVFRLLGPIISFSITIGSVDGEDGLRRGKDTRNIWLCYI